MQEEGPRCGSSGCSGQPAVLYAANVRQLHLSDYHMTSGDFHDLGHSN